jgi:hypothetical protein
MQGARRGPSIRPPGRYLTRKSLTSHRPQTLRGPPGIFPGRDGINRSTLQSNTPGGFADAGVSPTLDPVHRSNSVQVGQGVVVCGHVSDNQGRRSCDLDEHRRSAAHCAERLRADSITHRNGREHHVHIRQTRYLSLPVLHSSANDRDRRGRITRRCALRRLTARATLGAAPQGEADAPSGWPLTATPGLRAALDSAAQRGAKRRLTRMSVRVERRGHCRRRPERRGRRPSNNPPPLRTGYYFPVAAFATVLLTHALARHWRVRRASPNRLTDFRPLLHPVAMAVFTATF